ncbi:AAA family ATPase [Candidatus Poribacteria bacterium]|nr:AAA family ATPase [Candidatus Poribacteria bacterium]
MSLTAIHLKQFTAFDDLHVDFSPGINVLVGRNGTGKTHLMKVAYAACAITTPPHPAFPDKLLRDFTPAKRALHNLVKRQGGKAVAHVQVWRDQLDVFVNFGNDAGLHADEGDWAVSTDGWKEWQSKPINSAYIPVNDMLANAPGFRSLYARRELHFEEIYDDLLVRAYLPPLRESAETDSIALLEKHMGGTVVVRGEEFYLRQREGELQFSLVAEGIRKLGLLWLLLRNGTLEPGSVLFWDEPETYLNPELYGVAIGILLALQRSGVQIFLATHGYVALKELDLRGEREDKITYHALYRDEDTNEIACTSQDSYLDIHPNAIGDTFTDLYDREITRSLDGMGK